MVYDPTIQKTDSGMKSGQSALDACLAKLEKTYGNVQLVRGDLFGNWQGAASQAFLDSLEMWEQDYRDILKVLDKIAEDVKASDVQMNNTEHDATVVSKSAFTGGGTSNHVFGVVAPNAR